MKKFIIRCLAVTCTTPLISSCQLFTPAPPPPARTVLYEWHDDHGLGEVSVEIDLSKQTARFQRGGRPIGWSFVSTGKPGHATAAGTYVIQEKLPLKVSNRYGWIADHAGNVTVGDATPATPVPPENHYTGAPMHHWLRLTSYGIGMHAGEISRPGHAASHGCIRLPRDLAAELFAVAAVGTSVKIFRSEN